MKPINPYQGEAPRAMAQMGQGILETGANIAKTIQGGYEQMGQGLAKGITTATSAYADYKKLKTDTVADEKVLGTLTKYMTPEMKTMFEDTANSDMPYAEKNAMYKRAYEYIGGAVSQKQAMDKISAQGGVQAGLQTSQQAADAKRQADLLASNQKMQEDRLRADQDLARFNAVSKAVQEGGVMPAGGVAPGGGKNFSKERKMTIGGGVYGGN